jgi:hypothetical protein
MVRGKAFEFSVMLKLREILPQEEWNVDKEMLNAQLGSNDIDVGINHINSNTSISIECKLSKKESFRVLANGNYKVGVKCMRSRTLGAAMVKNLAPKLKVSESQLQTHNDQYLPEDFDIVVTSIGNAFYRTNSETRLFEWLPTEKEVHFLELLRKKVGFSKTGDLKEFAFNQMYAAKAPSLVISRKTGVRCTRKKCDNPDECGFIPNYPVIEFDSTSLTPVKGWVLINEVQKLLMDFIPQQKQGN